MTISKQRKKRHLFYWYNFEESKGYRQKRPPERRLVLVQILRIGNEHTCDPLSVGYLRYGSDRKDSPHFVVPSWPVSGFRVVAWCDCLGDDFMAPGWRIQPDQKTPQRTNENHA